MVASGQMAQMVAIVQIPMVVALQAMALELLVVDRHACGSLKVAPSVALLVPVSTGTLTRAYVPTLQSQH